MATVTSSLSGGAAGNHDHEDGEIMRAARLTRKTHFRKNAFRPGGGALVFDLTEAPDGGPEESESLALCDISLSGDAPFEDSAGDSAGHAPAVFRDCADALRWCVAVMVQSPVAGRLLDHAAREGWSVAAADLDNNGFYLDIPHRRLIIDHYGIAARALGRSAFFRNSMLTAFIRALRDIWHEHRTGPFEERFAPADVLMMERIRAADCDTVVVMAGWELRGAGFGGVWRHILGSSEGDMAAVFTRVLERDPSALFSGAALAYAFRQWHADESRVDGCDHETLEALDDFMQARSAQDGEATGGPSRLSGADVPSAADIEALSVLPGGECYLAGYGETVRTDPFFAGLGDPINQAHLFHLVYDTRVCLVNNVPFRDRSLAGKIFPEGGGLQGKA